MSRTKLINTEQDYFICRHCGRAVAASPHGHRNHCPYCLRSRHLDVRTGDRLSGCRSLMDPIAIWAKEGGEWAIVHRCRGCGLMRANRIAPDDDEDELLAIASSPLGDLPFPVAGAPRALIAIDESVGGAP